MTNTEVTLSPSSLNYEDRRCDRCFGEALNGESWPDRPFPGIFSKLDRDRTILAPIPFPDVRFGRKDR